MKTFNFEFNKKELSLLRKFLNAGISDLRLDVITFQRVGLSTKSQCKEILLAESILSKLS